MPLLDEHFGTFGVCTLNTKPYTYLVHSPGTCLQGRSPELLYLSQDCALFGTVPRNPQTRIPSRGNEHSLISSTTHKTSLAVLFLLTSLDTKACCAFFRHYLEPRTRFGFVGLTDSASPKKLKARCHSPATWTATCGSHTPRKPTAPLTTEARIFHLFIEPADSGNVLRIGS